MKKGILLSVFTCLLMFQASAQIEVTQEQRSLLAKYTATWCPNCGNWGWTFMEDIMEDNADKAVILGAHYSGTLQSGVVGDLLDNFNIQGQPTFTINNAKVGASNNNIAAKRIEVKDQVDAKFQESPVVNTGIAASITPENEILVQTRTLFFQETAGAYRLAIYVLEDNVEANQSGSVSDNIHPRVVRASFNGTFGDIIEVGEIAANTEFTGSYTLPIDANWNMDNIRIAAIIWSDHGDSYSFVNAYDTTTFGAPVATQNLVASDINFQLTPTIIQENGIVSFETEKANTTASVQLFDTNGRLVQRIFEGQLNQGVHQYNVTNQGYNGLYLVQIQLDGAVLTEKVIFE